MNNDNEGVQEPERPLLRSLHSERGSSSLDHLIAKFEQGRPTRNLKELEA